MQKGHRMIFMAICLCFSLILPSPAMGAKNFSDIKGHWANSYILNLTAKGYLNGYPDGSFKPDKSMSRAEFITALINSLGISPSEPSSNSFSDTKSHWARKYIEEAVERDILIPSEFPGGLGPDQTILRSQAAALLVRAMGLYPSSGSLNFTDNSEVARSMYRTHIKAICEEGIMSGYPDGSFKPFQVMNRAQVCTVLVKMLEKQGAISPVNNQPSTSSITTVAVGEDLFTLGKTNISFVIGTNDIAASSISAANSTLTINGSYSFALDRTSGNPDIIVGNTRFKVSRMTVNTNKLVIYPSDRFINEIKLNSILYNSKEISMYVEKKSDIFHLSDLVIRSETEVEINGQSYNIKDELVVLKVNSKYYQIKTIELLPGSTIPSLKETDFSIGRALKMSDISSITAGTKTLDLDDIDSISFIADGEKYKLSETMLDSNGTFTFDNKTYKYKYVTMVIDGIKYKITNIDYSKNKFKFTCLKANNEDQARFNGTYYDISEITIVKGSSQYDLEDISVPARNQINISGRKYTIPDTTIQCRVDGDLWDITRIEFSESLDMIVITATEADEDQDARFILYDDDENKLAEGTNSRVYLKVKTQWISFSKITVSDSDEFKYNSYTYSFVGSRVKIGTNEYRIDDTTWHKSTHTMDLFLVEV